MSPNEFEGQPIPAVSHADVERIVARDFAPAERAEVRALLDTYGTDEWQREADRVRLAVLKLAAGDIEGVRSSVALAKTDYRDVLLWAEYPAAAKRGAHKLSPTEDRKIVDSDWRQYQAWLTRS